VGTIPDIKPYAKVFSAAKVILAKSPPSDIQTWRASLHVAVGLSNETSFKQFPAWWATHCERVKSK